eukprot:Gregarina_sp_Poly_1__10414@NODE_74_length_15926_cov_73_224289_g63_i0_p2_GENE_NODE_74_length_15926_cov_73_224289_g63_i0NODE_74_length_15926_cov_73_224289_g63_i0_p2_ORF_typecomplete_len925_score131_25SNF2_N/PF00176_23/8_1e52Helicase_C/PF00271_31/1_6e04Helicase_C/PF00271_31/3e15ResIII/PF04851_15/2_7e11AAA_34/PF13872_6/3_9e03AAA_34/PF13872_6/8_7e05HDA23/PF11496_8/0_00092ERCC3_RAD25_C/PF16203_5/0_07_NODE_74_length_15926_cov_73_224289_g63_i01145914233
MDRKSGLDVCEAIYSSVLRGYRSDDERRTSEYSTSNIACDDSSIFLSRDFENENYQPSSSHGVPETESLSDIVSVDESPILRKTVPSPSSGSPLLSLTNSTTVGVAEVHRQSFMKPGNLSQVQVEPAFLYDRKLATSEEGQLPHPGDSEQFHGCKSDDGANKTDSALPSSRQKARILFPDSESDFIVTDPVATSDADNSVPAKTSPSSGRRTPTRSEKSGADRSGNGEEVGSPNDASVPQVSQKTHLAAVQTTKTVDRLSRASEDSVQETNKQMKQSISRRGHSLSKSKTFASNFKMTGFLRSFQDPAAVDALSSKVIDFNSVLHNPENRLQIKLIDIPSDSPSSNVPPSLPFLPKSAPPMSIPNGYVPNPDSLRVRGESAEEFSCQSVRMYPLKKNVGDKLLQLSDGSQFTIYEHQVKGIEWLELNFHQRTGCILADDMGLGKTVQTTIFLNELFESRKIRWVLVLSPKSVTNVWEDHLHRLCPAAAYHLFYGPNRTRRLEKFRASTEKGVVITTYETFRSSADVLAFCNIQGREWDVWVADEATQMKNASARVRKAAVTLRCQFALFLTGTPIMNNYEELWSLMDLVQPGLLGTHAEFKNQYSMLLDKKRWGTDVRRDQLATHLRDRVIQFILRRTKEEIFSPLQSPAQTLNGSRLDANERSELFPHLPLTLPAKTDLILWQDLGHLQLTIYRAAKKRIDYKDRSSLLYNISYLKKLCRHPVLCLPIAKQQWRFLSRIGAKPITPDEDEQELIGDTAAANWEASELFEELDLIESEIDQTNADDLRAACPKLESLYSLLPCLLAGNHSVLVFSESTATLDLIEKVVLDPLGCLHRTRRIDGSVDMKKRANLVDDFNNDPSIVIMLLSTGAAALGLTLTKADRVIMMDPSWNPAKDAQAIDRAHRIGQVVIKISCEKILTCHI